MIELRALGTAEIHTGSATLTPSQEVVFAAALYLILERGTSVSRRHLSSLLWPEAPEKVRAHRLRQTLHQLKKLGVSVRADRYKLEFSKQASFCDFDRIAARVTQMVGPARSLEFLAGYVPRLSEALRDWVDTKRADVHAAIASALVHELGVARNRGDWANVESITAVCLTLDPYNETAVLAQAEAAAMRGAKSQAVSILDRFLIEVGEDRKELRLPARILRSRIVERMPDHSARRRDEPFFVGRQKEMELLVRQLAEARAGRGGAVLVTGEPGIGKSRLGAELGRFALLQGGQVEQTACRRGDIDRPLSLFVDIVPRLRELPGALGCAPETFTALKRLTDFEQISREDVRRADSDALYTNVRTALFDLLDSIADERYLLILVDDVQWLDDQSARILARMTEWARTRRVLFLMNTRPGLNHLLEYTEQSQLSTISLGPLARGASDSLLRSIALQPDSEIDPDFASWSLSVAEGNPFFLQELAHQWIETGNKHQAPSSVTTVLERRMSRLSSEALQVLQTSAVLADHSTLNRVEAVLGLEAYQLLSAIEELNACAMLRQSADSVAGPSSGIQPRHELVSNTAVCRLSPVGLAFLHGRSADVLEREITHDVAPTTLLWACANHRHHAGDKEHALSLSLSCSEHLLAVGLAKESSEAFEKSLEYCSNDDQRLRVLPRLAFALQTCEEWTRSKETLATGVRLNAKVNPSPVPHNEYELLLLEARYHSSFEYKQLLEDITPCVESVDAPPRHRVRAGVTALKLATDIGPANVLDALYQHIAPVLHCDDVLEQDALEVELVYQTLRSDVLVPVEDLRRFLTAGRPSSLDYFNRLLTVTSACRLSGRYLEGLRFVEETLAYGTSHGLTNRLHQALTAAVQLHLVAEEYDKANATLHEIRRYPTSPENPRMYAEPSYLEGRIALEQQDLRRCSAALNQIVMLPSGYSSSRRAYFFALHVGLKVAEGANAEVLTPYVLELQDAHSRIQSVGIKDFETNSLFLGLSAIGKRDDAVTMLRSYVRSHRRSRWPLSKRLKQALSAAENPMLSGERMSESPTLQDTAVLSTDPLSGVL